MSESKGTAAAVGVSPECGCVNCRIGRRLAAMETMEKERDDAVALAFERGRALAALIQERDELRRAIAGSAAPLKPSITRSLDAPRSVSVIDGCGYVTTFLGPRSVKVEY